MTPEVPRSRSTGIRKWLKEPLVIPRWRRVLVIIGSCLTMLTIGALTTALFYRNPLPVPDRGHRTFEVRDTLRFRLATQLLEHSGLRQRMTFSAGPTLQRLFWDNETVLLMLTDSTARSRLGSGCSISRPVDDPIAEAEWAHALLTNAGIEADIRDVQPDSANRLVMLRADSLLGNGCNFVYRLSLMRLGRPREVKIE